MHRNDACSFFYVKPITLAEAPHSLSKAVFRSVAILLLDIPF